MTAGHALKKYKVTACAVPFVGFGNTKNVLANFQKIENQKPKHLNT